MTGTHLAYVIPKNHSKDKRSMKLRSVLFVICSFSLFISNAQNFQRAIDKARILIKAHQEQTKIPGLQVSCIVNDSLVWSEGFGLANIQKNEPIKKETQFRTASIAKPMTAMALGKMIEEGKIQLSDSIGKYLDYLPNDKKPITIKMLASSTSGIRHYNANDPKYSTTNYETVSAALVKFINDPLVFTPGSTFHYSSYGWVLLSAVMEQASGKSFFNLMEKTWEDLGMNNTAFDYPNTQNEQLSTFYIYDKKQGRTEAPTENRSFMYAGGGYISTAENLAQMGNAFINDRYLDEGTRWLLTQSQILGDGSDTHYALGWETGTNRHDTPIIYHSGSMSTSRTHLIIYPEEKIVFAYMANTGDRIFFNDREAQNIVELFLSPKSSNDKVDESKLIGDWSINTTSLKDKSTDGTMSLKLNDQGLISGNITFVRSKKKETFPIVVVGKKDGYYHLIAVSPMFIDIYLKIEGTSIIGHWLHDFNVNGTPEPDPYWRLRKLKGIKQ